VRCALHRPGTWPHCMPPLLISSRPQPSTRPTNQPHVPCPCQPAAEPRHDRGRSECVASAATCGVSREHTPPLIAAGPQTPRAPSTHHLPLKEPLALNSTPLPASVHSSFTRMNHNCVSPSPNIRQTAARTRTTPLQTSKPGFVEFHCARVLHTHWYLLVSIQGPRGARLSTLGAEGHGLARARAPSCLLGQPWVLTALE